MNHKKLLLIFSILLVLLCSLTAISASDLNDTDVIANDDAEDEIILSDADIENDMTTEPGSGNTFTDLNAIIADAGNVNLTRDYEYNESDGESFPQGIVIDRDNVVIDGNGHYITGGMHNRVFNISNANNVTLKNITFLNSGSDRIKINGGALYIEESSNITIINCIFEYNRADNGDGGAIYVKSTDPIMIIDSKFKENHAKYGGAITAHNVTLILENATFTDNQATEIGGALNGAHSTQIINNCRFMGNAIYGGAGGYRMGGAIYGEQFDEDNEIIITNTKFLHNYAYDYGGAVYIKNETKVLIEDSKFFGNNADEGGAIVCGKANVTIRNTEFNENHGRTGGAVQVGPSTLIEDCNFTGNYAEDSVGGAIHVISRGENANAIIKNCNFLNNFAETGGAIYIMNKVTILNCNFTSNKASNNAGAIGSQTNKKVTIENTTFMDNNASQNGGAIRASSEILIENSHFINNNAANWGGAIAYFAVNAVINNTDFSKNSAKSGGAIYLWEFTSLSVNNTEFTQNTATSDGGAMYIQGRLEGNSNGTIENTRFVQNTANEGSGQIAISNQKVNLTLKNVTPSDLIPKFPVIMEVSEVSDVNYTQYVSINAFNITCFAFPLSNGSIVVSINGANYSAPVMRGVATLNISNLDAGSYKVNVTYIGDVEYANPTRTVEFNVLKLPAVVEVINVTNCTYGDSIQITVNVTNGSSAINEGNVSVVVNGNVYSTNVDNGSATFDIAGLFAGTYEVNLTYAGNYYADSVPVKFEVKRQVDPSDPTKYAVEMKIEVNNVNYTQPVVIKAYNITRSDEILNNGSIVVGVNGGNYSAKVENGEATLTIPGLNAGSYNVNVTYIGDAENANPVRAAEFNVLKLPATIEEVNIANAYIINYGGKCSIALKDVMGNAPAGEKVTFTLNGKAIGSAVTGNDGVASIQLTPAILKTAKTGKKDLVIKFDSANYNAADKTVKVTVNKEKTKILKAKKTYKFKRSKKAKNIKVTLKDSKNKVIKSVKVTVKLSGKKIKGKKTVTAKTNKKGVVTFKLGKKLTKKTKVKYTITFKGNDYYNKVVKKGKIVIK